MQQLTTPITNDAEAREVVLALTRIIDERLKAIAPRPLGSCSACAGTGIVEKRREIGAGVLQIMQTRCTKCGGPPPNPPDTKTKIALDLLAWQRGRTAAERLLFKTALDTALEDEAIVKMMRDLTI
jgi:hypothetical protein